MSITIENTIGREVIRNYKTNVEKQEKSSEKLSSGYRINRSADDAAGLAISEKMRGHIRGFDRGAENTTFGINLCKIADGVLAEVNDMVNRVRELAVQAANDTNTNDDRNCLQGEVVQISEEVDRIMNDTEYNTLKIFESHDNFDKKNPTEPTYLVKCPSIGKGYLSESYKKGNMYHSAATLDFSNVNSTNVVLLYGKNFSFTYSQACGETFTFTMTGNAYNTSTLKNPIGTVNHEYTVGIEGCQNGKEVLDRLFQFVYDHPSNNYSFSSKDSEMKVSHSNSILRTGDNSFVLFGSSSYNSAEEAENFQKNRYPYGAVDAAQLADDITDTKNSLWIHTGPGVNEGLYLDIPVLNSQKLKLDRIDISTHSGASAGISLADYAQFKVNRARGVIGGQQNRLESAYNYTMNSLINLQDAESNIRDQDIADEMVVHAKNNILMNAGESFMVHKRQDASSVLALLQ